MINLIWNRFSEFCSLTLDNSRLIDVSRWNQWTRWRYSLNTLYHVVQWFIHNQKPNIWNKYDHCIDFMKDLFKVMVKKLLCLRAKIIESEAICTPWIISIDWFLSFVLNANRAQKSFLWMVEVLKEKSQKVSKKKDFKCDDDEELRRKNKPKLSVECWTLITFDEG